MRSKLKERRLVFGSRLIDVANRSGLSIGKIWNSKNGLAHRVEDETRRKMAKCLESWIEEISGKD